jgi:hypothetical protein
MNQILKAYNKKINEVEHNQFSELQEMIYTILDQQELGDLNNLGKELGIRINAALEDAYKVAPKEYKDAFKDAVKKGMK